MTRAQSQVVAWWSPAYDEPNGGLSRLLRGREPGESTVPDRCVPAKISDDDAMARLQKWEAAGGLVIEESVVAPPAPRCRRAPTKSTSKSRHFHRAIDTAWRRTSYSGLIRAAETTRGEQRAGSHRAGRRGRRDPVDGVGGRGRTCRRRWRICRRARSSARWCTRCWRRRTRSRPTWPPSWSRRSASTRCGGRSTSRPSELAAAMVPMHDTPLGPLADGVTLRQIGLQDRLREMDFEFPLGGRGSARGGTGHPAGRRGRAAARASACRRPVGDAMPTG